MALITDIIAKAELLGIRVYSLNATCPSTTIDNDTHLDISTKCSLDASESKKNSAFATIEVNVSVNTPEEGEHVIFNLEMQGFYRWPEEFELGSLLDNRLANLLCRPIYSAAIMELKKMSSSMDLGELYLDTNLPWPDDAAQDLN